MTLRTLTCLTFGCFMLLTASVEAADALYTVRSVREAQGDVWVDNAYRVGPCIEVVVVVKQDLGPKKPFLHAYFYDKEKKLIETMRAPSALGSDNPPGYGDPGVYKRNDKYTMLFGIRKAFQQGEGNPWKTVIVVFGDEKEMVAEAWPKRTDLNEFNFPEKEKCIQQSAIQLIK